MAQSSLRTVAVVGTGVIGRSWLHVFARAGCRVRAFDADPAQRERARRWLEGDLASLVAGRAITRREAKARWERVTAPASLAEALAGAGWVQESGPERLDAKRALFAELDRHADPGAILASSTSAMDMSDIAAGLAGARRAIVAHPVNPPHVIPVVEVLGGRATDPEVVRRSLRFLRAIGQAPVLMHRFTPGFILNRMQAALVREAVDLVQSGVADVDAVDATIRDGLGLRWALMGPFGVANTNADGGVREYFTRFRDAYHGLWSQLSSDVRFTDELVERLGQETDRMTRVPLEAQRAWRDRLVQAIRALKTEQPLRGARRRGGRRRRPG